LDAIYFSPKPKDYDDQSSQPFMQNPNRTLLYDRLITAVRLKLADHHIIY